MNDPKMEQILRDVQKIDIVQIVIILLVAWLLAKAVERFLPWLAERVTGRLRLYILPSVPVLRLVIPHELSRVGGRKSLDGLGLR